MSPSLSWFAAPLLFVPIVARRQRRGGAAGQLIIAGLGLGALHQGAGTLDLADLSAIIRQGAGDAWFVGLTAGMIATGGGLLPDVRNWWKLAAGVPLALAAFVIGVAAPVPLLVGAAIGCGPSLAGWATGRRQAAASPPMRHGVRHVTAVLAVLTIISAVAGPELLTMLLLCGLTWVDTQTAVHFTDDSPTVPGHPVWRRLRCLAATGFLVAWTWLALTIAGSLAIGLNEFGTDAPVSLAASQWLALLAIGWGILIAAPWPIDDRSGSAVRLPVLAIVLYLAAAQATPDGMAHWQPPLTIALVPVVLIAVASRRWTGAAGAMVVLAATRSGTLAVVTALAAGILPAGSALVRSPRIRGLVPGAIAAAVVIVVLRDQVLLAVVLALGLATMANRTDRVVAPT
jgi:hypothetical protein